MYFIGVLISYTHSFSISWSSVDIDDILNNRLMLAISKSYSITPWNKEVKPMISLHYSGSVNIDEVERTMD